MTDLLIAGGLVVDGSGSAPSPATVAVQGDRIERLIRPGMAEPSAARRVDVAGRVVAPGFVDVHDHSDLSPLAEPWMDSMLRQGITTVVVGNCGSSAVPPAGLAEMAGWTGLPPRELDLLDLSWTTLAGYLERVDAARPAVNVATLVGHGALRLQAMGDERRAPTPDELRAMRTLLARGMEEGAVGLSSGLIYTPGIHATTEELVELAAALDGVGLYASHVRGEGEPVFEAVEECIEIGRRAGVPSHVSHLKLETDLVWGRAEELLARIDEARAAGDDVSADQYPYPAWESELASLLPPWAGPADLPRLLADAGTRERLVRSVERGEPGWQSSVRGVGWDRLVIVAHAGSTEHTGRSIAEIAAATGTEPAQAMFDLLMRDPRTSLIGHAMLEDDVRTIVAREDVMVATDGVAVSPEGPMGRFNVHPRYYGTFPRVLGRYVREEGLLSIGAAIRKMTSLPAGRFGLAGRGRIVPGAFADLVVFDPHRIADRATFEAPHAFPEGIELVVVNGRVAWDGERRERAGRALRRTDR
ncbi:MAG: amidohydrolase family protein [Candidatus Velamenicoccus archaeovorus]